MGTGRGERRLIVSILSTDPATGQVWHVFDAYPPEEVEQRLVLTIAVADDNDFGLSANAWTRDAVEQAVLSEQIAAGAVFVQGMTASCPSLPFGGIKASGYGRELAAFGMREFCNAKTIREA